MGRELTLSLLRRGAKVAAIDRSTDSLSETAALADRYQDALATWTVDITDRAAVDALVHSVDERFGQADGLINCAGVIQPFVKINDLDMGDIERVFAVNFRGTLYMTKAFLPGLLRRPEAHIVNISSMGGFLPVPGQTAYGASKAAVKLLTEGLHAELADTQVHVTVVFPGAINTDIAKNSGVTLSATLIEKGASHKTASAQDAAREIIDGMERNRYRVLVGRDAKIMDALYRLAPERATAIITKQMKQFLSS